MKLREYLFKPRWQAKDAATRRDSVARDDDAELAAVLATIAREDDDAGVRLAALRRMADVGLAQKLAHDDADAGVRSAAKSLWHDLLSGAHPTSPPLAERLRLLRAQDSPDFIEHLLRHGVEADLRRAALARIERPSLLMERAIEDDDAGVRMAALERIDDEAQLARLAEKVRKSDKTLQRLARQRIDTLRIARGDSSAIEAQARVLCAQFEQLASETHAHAREAAIETQWQTIADRVSPSIATRFDNARQLLAKAREVANAATTPHIPEQPSGASTDPDSVSLTAPEVDAGTMEALAGNDNLPQAADVSSPEESGDNATPTDSSTNDTNETDNESVHDAAVDIGEEEARAKSESAVDLAAKREQHQQKLAAIETAIADLVDALERGETTPAHAAHARVVTLRRAYGERLPRALHARLTEIEPRYDELRQWQRWADNQRRRQLCTEIESLAGSGLHPDAIATRVREAQTEWQALDASEGGQRGGRASSTLARHFHVAGRAALEPAKPYFEKRHELRQTHAQEVAGLLARIASINTDAQPADALVALRRETAAGLRDLDRVEPRERKVLARALRDAMETLDARIDAHFAEVESAREALIAEALALADQEDVRKSISDARTLQKRWTEIANGRRKRDQAQWKVFRSAQDAVFARADAERDAQTAKETELRAQAETLCAELEALVLSNDAPERGAVTRIDTAWRALGSLDQALRERHQSAQDALREASKRQAQARRRVPYDAWLTRYRLCVAAEQPDASLDALREEWNAPAPSDVAATALQHRFDAALAGNPSSAGEGSVQDILIELEQLADIEPSAADRERRMQLRLEKLSGHLRGTDAQSLDSAFAELLNGWTRAVPAPDEDSMRRFERAFEVIVGRIMHKRMD